MGSISYDSNPVYESDQQPSLCPALAIPGVALNMFYGPNTQLTQLMVVWVS